MAVRERIREWLGVDARVRELLRQELGARSLATAADVGSLGERLASLSERIDGVDKKLKMAMGSVQASSTQLMGLVNGVDALKAQLAQAAQQATTARSTAEAASEGLVALEQQLAALAAPAAVAAPAPRPRAKNKSS